MNKIQISQSIKVLVGVIVVSVISFPIAASAAPIGFTAPPPPTPTAVPEPFTIIGTIIGGTAAFRMRKKLKAITK
jgi:hypothetical protein